MTPDRWVRRVEAWLTAQRAALLDGDLKALTRLAEQAGRALASPPTGIATAELARLRAEAGHVARLLMAVRQGVAQAMATVQRDPGDMAKRVVFQTYDARGNRAALGAPGSSGGMR